MSTHTTLCTGSALICTLATSATAEPLPIINDSGVEQSTYHSFEELSPSQLWQTLNELEYWAVPQSPPSGYYDNLNMQSSDQLWESLHELVDDHVIYNYSHTSRPMNEAHTVDVWDIVSMADAHPENPDQVIDLYLNGTFSRQLVGIETYPRYDREHSWPKSLGFPKKTIKNPAYSDCHHLFAAYQSFNSSRSNKPYGDGDLNAEDRRTTLENLGRGGSFHDDDESANYSYSDVWQTWIGRRGDVARAMFYMAVRYEGEKIGKIGEADLQLTDDITLIRQRDVWESTGVAYMGLLSVLLDWHDEDPVDDLERRRNTVVYLFQGNRNPFIDHPEWAGVLFADEPIVVDDGDLANIENTWINELHYDNAEADQGEFVEIAGRAGTNLDGWELVGYNGNGGRSYKSVELSGVIPDQMNGFGTLAFDFMGLQNGSPDGVALIDSAGQVVELISYEGYFTAVDGAAADLVSVVIPASEDGSTAVGQSIQRIGEGASGSGFMWAVSPGLSSPGSINSDQVFGE